MSSSPVEIQNDKATQIIAINRPQVYGALDKETKEELTRALEKANSDSRIRSLILTGKGKAFCSGQDLNDRSLQKGQGPLDLGETLEREWNPLINALREGDKIVIGAINGVCAGAGFAVALACDLLVAKPKTKFVSGFSQLGLAPDCGLSFSLVKSLGYQKSLEFFLWNRPLSTEELHAQGLINSLSEDPLEKAKEMAGELNEMAPLSLKLIKQNLHRSLEISFRESLQREIKSQRSLGNSQDYQEGLKAFFEKRTPQFKG